MSRCIFTVIVVFIAVFAFDFLVHGFLLKQAYSDTASLWRPEAEYKFPVMLLSQFLFALFFTYLYTRHHEQKGIGEGVRFGTYIGLILAAIEIGKYAYMPVPLFLPLAWAGTQFLKSVIIGMICSLMLQKSSA